MVIYEIEEIHFDGCQYIHEQSWYYADEDKAEFEYALLQEANTYTWVAYNIYQINVNEDKL